MVFGTPIGDDVFVHYHIARIVAEAIKELKHMFSSLKDRSMQGAVALLLYSKSTLLNHIGMMNRPEVIIPYLEKFQKVIDECLSIALRTDISELDQDSLIRYRIELRKAKGGLGFGNLPWQARQAFVGMICGALPRIITRKVKLSDGRIKWQKGCCPFLDEYLGNSTCFNYDQVDRFTKVVSEGTMAKSITCNAFYHHYRELQSEAGYPLQGILSTPAEGAGSLDGNVLPKFQMLCTQQLEDERWKTADRRFRSLDRKNRLRQAWVYCREGGSPSEFFGTCATRRLVLSNDDFSIACNNFIGLPIHYLKPYVGQYIGRKYSLDEYGDRLNHTFRNVPNFLKRRHDSFLDTMGYILSFT
eukprot:CAMPEP_0118648540 /NCGR_PEP_ID=MMETSP0785-20121206/9210_1 /TAXON_ID=91992 /ORGANISM="Bolidomonas pacifica, Strain CCMP 1866" /LENGTH=357 /DNA_ID=CAMNT_0006540739 /DNA_START=15 /DNA_END=1088 /DNA_ORIENTATION=+